MIDEKAIKRFLSKVKVLENGCHEWQGSRFNARKGEEAKPGNGYGQFRFEGKVMLAHRWSWEYLEGNKLPVDLCVLHTCDNPKCVNPQHLFLGSRADNNADKKAKGRHVSLKGEDNPRAKLDEDKVKFIRQMCSLPAPDRPTHRELAKLFDVDRTLIGHIVSRKTWKHVV